MKIEMLMIALTGFTAVGCYAQNDAYICTEKFVQAKQIQITQIEPTTGDFPYYSYDTELRTVTLAPTETLVPAATVLPTESCYQYGEHNMKVTQCPGMTYKSDGNHVFEYNNNGVYLGYYPIEHTTVTIQPANLTCVKAKPAPPQHVTYEWVVPANANPEKKECGPALK